MHNATWAVLSVNENLLVLGGRVFKLFKALL